MVAFESWAVGETFKGLESKGLKILVSPVRFLVAPLLENEKLWNPLKYSHFSGFFLYPQPAEICNLVQLKIADSVVFFESHGKTTELYHISLILNNLRDSFLGVKIYICKPSWMMEKSKTWCRFSHLTRRLEKEVR